MSNLVLPLILGVLTVLPPFLLIAWFQQKDAVKKKTARRWDAPDRPRGLLRRALCADPAEHPRSRHGMGTALSAPRVLRHSFPVRIVPPRKKGGI